MCALVSCQLIPDGPSQSSAVKLRTSAAKGWSAAGDNATCPKRECGRVGRLGGRQLFACSGSCLARFRTLPPSTSSSSSWSTESIRREAFFLLLLWLACDVMAPAPCISCSNGQYCSGGTACVVCPVGYYCTGTGLAAIETACPAGRYSAVTGATACTNCSAGTYSSTVGASSNTSCLSCPSGDFCPDGSSAAVSAQISVDNTTTSLVQWVHEFEAPHHALYVILCRLHVRLDTIARHPQQKRHVVSEPTTPAQGPSRQPPVCRVRNSCWRDQMCALAHL